MAFFSERGGVANPFSPDAGDLDLSSENLPILEPDTGAAANLLDYSEWFFDFEPDISYVVTAVGIGQTPVVLPWIGFLGSPWQDGFSGGAFVAQSVVSYGEEPETLITIGSDAEFEYGENYPIAYETMAYRLSVLEAVAIEDKNLDVVGGEPDVARDLHVGEALLAWRNDENDVDTFRIVATPGTSFLLTLTPVGDEPLGNTSLDLLIDRGDGPEFFRGRSVAAPVQIQYSFVAPEDGIIFAEVVPSEFYGPSSGEYVISVVQTFDAVPDNATTQHTIAEDQTVIGFIEGDGDRDWYRFDARGGTGYTISVDGNFAESVDLPALAIYDVAGNLLQTTTSETFYEVATTFASRTDSTVFIEVRDRSDTGYPQPGGTFELRVEVLGGGDDGSTTVFAAGSSVAEGAPGETKSLAFVIGRSGNVEGRAEITYRIEGGSADVSDVAGALPRTGTVVLEPFETSATVSVAISGDYQVEGDESVVLNIVSANGDGLSPLTIGSGEATGIIVNDDAPQSVRIYTGSGGAEAGAATVVFGIQRLGSPVGELVVDVSIAGGSASSADVLGGLPLRQTLTFAEGETVRFLNVTPVDDRIIENDETVVATIEQATLSGFEPVTIEDASATATIVDNDEATRVSLSAAASSISEGDAGGRTVDFVVRRDGDTSGFTAVDYSVAIGETVPRQYTHLVFVSRSDWDWRGQFDRAEQRVAGTATTLIEQRRPPGDALTVQTPLIATFDLNGGTPVSLNELAGGRAPLDIEGPIAQVGGSFTIPLPPALGGSLSASLAADVGATLTLKVEEASAGAFDVQSTVSSGFLVPAFVTEGESFDITIPSAVRLFHRYEGETLTFGGFEIGLEVNGSLSLRDVLVEAFGTDVANFGNIDLTDFSLETTLIDATLDVVEGEFIDGIDYFLAAPDGNNVARNGSSNGITPNTFVAGDLLASITFSLFELASNFPALRALDLLKEDETFEWPPNSDNPTVLLELAFTLLDVFAEVGIALVQEFTITPTLSISAEVDGAVQTGSPGNSFTFTVPDGSGFVNGSLSYVLGAALDVAYKLAPVGTIGYEALKGAIRLEETVLGNELEASIGPVFQDSESYRRFADGLDLFSIEDIDLSGFFEPWIHEFAIPVREVPPPEDALAVGTVVFAPGETEKVISVPILQDLLPEANQELVARIDTAVPIGGGVVEIGQDEATTLVIDDDTSREVIRLVRRLEADWWGDPHIVTLDGLSYDFQAVGEFTLLRVDGPSPLEIQTRTAAVPGSDVASQITRIATVLDGRTIEIDASAPVPLLIDRVPVEIPVVPGVLELGDEAISFDGQAYSLRFAGGDEAVVGIFDGFLGVCIFLADEPGRTVTGLLGNADGDPLNDLRLPDGTVLTIPVPFAELYGPFADAWRVSDGLEGNSLFTYAAGESTLTFTDYDFPRTAVSVAGLPELVREAAEAAVDAAGITDPILRENAILDFALTGNDAFLTAARAVVAAPDIAAEPSEVPRVSLVGLAALQQNVAEGDADGATVLFALYATSPLSTDVAYELSYGGSAAARIIDAPSSVSLPAGSSLLPFEVTLSGDDAAGDDLELLISLLAGDPSVLIASSSVQATIIDDDRPALPNLTFSVADDDVAEGTGAPTEVTVTFTLDAPAASDTTISVALTAPVLGPAADDDDFAAETMRSFDLVIEAGRLNAEHVILLEADALREPDEAFRVLVTHVDGATLASRAVTVGIVNDDENAAPLAGALDLGTLSESDPAGAFALLSGAVDPDGDVLSVRSVTASDDRGDPVAFDYASASDSLVIDPGQFATALSAGEARTVTFRYEIGDGAATIARVATLEVEGRDGPFEFFADLDGDGFGDPSERTTGYVRSEVSTLVAGDADDTRNTVYPNAPELPDGLDNDQDGFVDEGLGTGEPLFQSDATFSAAENQTGAGTVVASDPEGAALTYAIVGGVDAALFSIGPTSGSLTFYAAPDFEAPDDEDADNVYLVTVSASDGVTASEQAIAVTVTNIDEAPSIAGDLTLAVDEGGSVVLTPADLAASDAESGPADLVFAVSDLVAGTLEVSGAAAASFTGADLAAGLVAFVHDGSEGVSAGFDVLLSDGALADIATVNVIVTPTNDAPVATDDAGFDTPHNLPLIFAPAELLENDHDGDQASTQTLTITKVIDGTGGTVALDGSGNVIFTPAPGFFGTADFTYIASDGDLTDTATVTLEVSAPIDGTPDPDGLAGTPERDWINGFGGNDTLAGLGAADTILGADGSDLLRGSDGDDSLDGGEGNDKLAGDEGADTLIGGEGNDRLDIDQEDVNTGLVDAGAGDDLIVADGTVFGLDMDAAAAERFLGSGGDDVVSAGTGRVTLNGRGGNDTLTGGSGNDRIVGGNGSDSIAGGGGNDRLLIDQDDIDGGAIDAGGGYDVIVAFPRITGLDMSVANAEQFRGGEADDAVVTRGTESVILLGFGGSDALSGGGGDDRLLGDTGSDTLGGGAGADNILGGAEDDVLDGGSGNDRLVGGNGDDHVSGSDGNDRLLGEDGADTLVGGLGDDVFVGGAGGDVILYEALASGRDRINDFGTDDRVTFDALLGLTETDLRLSAANAGALLYDGVGGTILVAGINPDDLTFAVNSGTGDLEVMLG